VANVVGVILAGGTGSRLKPLMTNGINKNILPVGNKPMLLYPIEKLKEAGITKICVVTGVEHIGAVVGLLRSGEDYGVDITYRVQEKPNGIAAAVGLAKDFVGGDHFVTILGDNVFETTAIKGMARLYRASIDLNCAVVCVKAVPDPERFGVVEYGEDGLPINIHEKPTNPPSNHAVIGIYAYPPDAFDFIAKLKPSARGEYEITDLNNCYLKQGNLRTVLTDGFWIDAGTLATYKQANQWAWSIND